MSRRGYYSSFYRARKIALMILKADLLEVLPYGWTIILAHGWSFHVLDQNGESVSEEKIPKRIVNIRNGYGDHFEQCFGYENERIKQMRKKISTG